MPRQRSRGGGLTYPILNIWPPLPLGVYMRRPARRLAFPLSEPGCSLHALGRHALWVGAGVLGLEPGDEVLVPAYHHGSEVEALVRRGACCRFYEASPTLEPDPDELESLVSGRTRALLVIHYLGFSQDARRWRRWCEDRGMVLIEDVAQGWPGTVGGRPLGSEGHLSIFCLYKTFGLPDGAALLVEGSSAGVSSRARLGIALLARRHLAWIRSRSTAVARALPWTPEPPDHPDAELALGDPSVGASRTTTFVLPRVFDPEVAKPAVRITASSSIAWALGSPLLSTHYPTARAPFCSRCVRNERTISLPALPKRTSGPLASGPSLTPCCRRTVSRERRCAAPSSACRFIRNYAMRTSNESPWPSPNMLEVAADLPGLASSGTILPIVWTRPPSCVLVGSRPGGPPSGTASSSSPRCGVGGNSSRSCRSRAGAMVSEVRPMITRHAWVPLVKDQEAASDLARALLARKPRTLRMEYIDSSSTSISRAQEIRRGTRTTDCSNESGNDRRMLRSRGRGSSTKALSRGRSAVILRVVAAGSPTKAALNSTFGTVQITFLSFSTRAGRSSRLGGKVERELRCARARKPRRSTRRSPTGQLGAASFAFRSCGWEVGLSRFSTASRMLASITFSRVATTRATARLRPGSSLCKRFSSVPSRRT